MLHAVVLADTHLRPGSRRRLLDSAYRHLERADVILHAGDIVTGDLLDELSGFAPVHAVLGNNDLDLVGVLPEVRSVELAGVRVGLVHDSGPRQGRSARLHHRFPAAAIVVFGHSHIPWDEEGVGGQILFNPGSPTDRRAQPHHTLGTLDLDDGRVVARALHRL